MPSSHKGPSAFTSNGKIRANRAVQFMPFASLRGYYDQVRKQERIVQERREHTEEEIQLLSQQLRSIKKGSVIRIKHYDTDAYVFSCGAVSEIVFELQWLRLVKTRIDFEDIYEIEVLSS